MKSLTCLVMFISSFPLISQAASDVSIAFGTQSSIAWLKLHQGEVDPSVKCVAKVLRPTYGDDGLASAENQIVCESQKGRFEYSLATEKVEAWGTHFEKSHFSFSGVKANELWAKFKTQTVNMTELDSERGIWSRIILCDPNGNFCGSMYSLNDSASVNSSGKVLCAQNTELLKSVEASDDRARVRDASNPSQFNEDRIDAQLKSGERRIVSTSCVVLN